MILILAVVLGGAAAACQKAKPPDAPAPVGAGFDERQACTTDADCAVVEIECCDHCNGGTAVGVSKDTAAEIRAEYAPADSCKETACTLMACADDAVPICRQERCGYAQGGQEHVTPLPRR